MPNPFTKIEVFDVEYIRHSKTPLLARLYRPKADGPFPLVIDVHGGGWCKKHRMTDVGTDEPLAKSGVVVAALDFRMPPDAGYPASLADINFAIRWFKLHAAEFAIDRNRVGILGFSSGGHQAMLTGLRPEDPRYSALTVAGGSAFDAIVRCVVLCWPVIDPLGRYFYAKQRLERDRASGAEITRPRHDQYLPYWPTEAAMAEGNPTLALERGEPVRLPPVLYLQGTDDDGHPRENLERFIAIYRKAGGRIELHWFERMRQSFLTQDPHSPAARTAIDKIIDFVHREIGAQSIQ